MILIFEALKNKSQFASMEAIQAMVKEGTTATQQNEQPKEEKTVNPKGIDRVNYKLKMN